ncbi:hypothetical protein LINPERHAP2_LOCUS34047, partial [Linum perenne]
DEGGIFVIRGRWQFRKYKNPNLSHIKTKFGPKFISLLSLFLGSRSLSLFFSHFHLPLLFPSSSSSSPTMNKGNTKKKNQTSPDDTAAGNLSSVKRRAPPLSPPSPLVPAAVSSPPPLHLVVAAIASSRCRRRRHLRVHVAVAVAGPRSTRRRRIRLRRSKPEQTPSVDRKGPSSASDRRLSSPFGRRRCFI